MKGYEQIIKDTPKMNLRPVEVGWLIEIKINGPSYYGEQDDGIVGWTSEHSRAIRFARREDAERVIRLEGFTEAAAVEHQWQ